MKKSILIATFYFLCRFISFAQEGSYYINNYTPSAYGAGDQNWSIVQDSLGRLFVANNDAVMMYDGKYWQMTELTGGKIVSSVAKTSNNIILVGAVGDFGYLDMQSSGKIKYVSLSTSLPEIEKDFSQIWAIHSIDSNQFFCANEKIFWFVGKKFKKAFKPTGEKFHTFFKVDNSLIVREQGVGFLVFKNGELRKIKNTEEFADTRVYSVLPYKNNLFWVCSRKGLYIFKFNKRNNEQSSVSKINAPEADAWMIENDVYCGAKISDNLYALGSIKNGVLLVDRTFTPVNHINYSQSGLQEDAVKCIYLDYAGNIWLALNKGLSHVQINTPLKHWNKINGIRGTIESVAKLNHTIYIASDKGVDKLNTTTNIFEPTGITDASWDLMLDKNILLAATNTGIYEITPSSFQKIFDAPDGAYKIYINPTNREQLFIARENSLLLAKYADHTIDIIKEFDYATGIRSMVSNKQGKVFLGYDNVYMFDPSKPDTLTIFSEQDGINTNNENYVFTYNHDVFVATEGGLLTFKEKPKNTFIKDPKFNLFNANFQMQKALQVGDDIWLSLLTISESLVSLDGDGLCVLKKTPNGFTKEYKFFAQMKSLKAHC
ncbi:MAG TPA: hypothetical protein VN698_13650, partial [Bacteroidia bacterium]|nr:hypothetical protein [Bacteroidia bacterium]